MKKVSVINELSLREFAAQFETQDEADTWIEKQVSKNSWGENERYINEADIPEELRSRIISTVVTEAVEAVEYQPATVAIEASEGAEAIEAQDEIQAVEAVEYNMVHLVKADYLITIEDYIDLDLIKKERDRILKGSDWLFVSDVPVTTAHRNYYRDYRTSLRNLNVELGSLEVFEDFLRRTQPGEFMDGGDSEAIIAKFNYYL